MKNALQVPPQYPQFGELDAMHEAKVKRDVLRAGLVALMRDGFDARHPEVQALLLADERRRGADRRAPKAEGAQVQGFDADDFSRPGGSR